MYFFCNIYAKYFIYFYDSQGMVIERYFGDDLIHLKASGVKRLLGEIDKQINIVENFENCVFKSHHHKKGVSHRGNPTMNHRKPIGGRKRAEPHQNHEDVSTTKDSAVLCYKCGETNHETSQCRHKGQLECYHCGFKGHKSGRCLNK